VLLSALVALTLTPALCQMMLRPRKEMRGPLGKFIRGFNNVFDKTTNGYLSVVRVTLRRMALAGVVLLAIYAGTSGLTKILPTSFVPDEDLGYYFAIFQLPEGASMERTDILTKRAEEDIKKIKGVKEVLAMGGLNLMTNAYTSNYSSLIVILKPWDEREDEEQQLGAILANTRRACAKYPEAISVVFPPPTLPGMGNASGFQFELQDRAGSTPVGLSQAVRQFIDQASKDPQVANLYTSFSTNVPQVDLAIDRDKVRTLDIPINSVFQGLQIYLGGLQVNDFNLFGRTYKVMVQAEPEFRATPENIGNIYVRSNDGAMVPLSTLGAVSMVTGPDLLQRYNMYRTAEITGMPAPKKSSGQALEAMEGMAAKLPQGYGFEWTNVAYQEKKAGGSQGIILVLALVFVFLVLAAQYESWAVPFSVLLGLPIGVFGALLFAWMRGLSNDVFVQVGIVALMGLAAKNAILIVEFAKEQHERAGKPLREAAIEGARLRFRPILMTAFAFILGVVPLYISHGAGSAARKSIGTSVFGGMLIATVVGLFFIPMLYVFVQNLAYRFGSKPKEVPALAGQPALQGGHH
jgi:HAE1 family hydrophobic/amphiphilic exporter-1/multidrug efflux pump